MMDQYLRMKKGLPEDVLLFFRLGDFYEMFFEDAKEASAILGLTLTKRHGIPMCGVPHHSAEGYIGRLVKGGKRVAIAEQTTIPQPGKLVERELTRVISAGTLADMNLLDSSRHNYIVVLYKDKKRFGRRFRGAPGCGRDRTNGPGGEDRGQDQPAGLQHQPQRGRPGQEPYAAWQRQGESASDQSGQATAHSTRPCWSPGKSWVPEKNCVVTHSRVPICSFR